MSYNFDLNFCKTSMAHSLVGKAADTINLAFFRQKET